MFVCVLEHARVHSLHVYCMYACNMIHTHIGYRHTINSSEYPTNFGKFMLLSRSDSIKYVSYIHYTFVCIRFVCVCIFEFHGVNGAHMFSS